VAGVTAAGADAVAAIAEPEPIVLDAGVIVALLDRDDAHHRWAHATIRALGHGRIVVAALSLAEALVHPAAAGAGELAHQRVSELRPKVVSTTADDVLQLADLRGHTRLRMPDVVVLYTALSLRAAVATTDGRLARVAAERGVVTFAPDLEVGDLRVDGAGGGPEA
jgi:predicted nucleic acid-binding protein